MSRLDDLRERLRTLELELLEELHLDQAARGYHLEGRRIRVEAAILRAHRHRRKRVRHFLLEARMSSFLTGPVIYLALLPAMALDLYVSLYQAVCFPAYGIPKVRRSDYLVWDRRHLPYLNWVEKLNCHYCGYFNGLMAYVQEIAARTEQHWCPIKHARIPKAVHSRYRLFFEYGDAEAYRAHLEQVRRDFADLERRPAAQGTVRAPIDM